MLIVRWVCLQILIIRRGLIAKFDYSARNVANFDYSAGIVANFDYSAGVF